MKTLIFILLCLINTKLIAQVSTSISLPSVVLLDIEPNNAPITLNYLPPTEAGNSISVAGSDNTKWINFSSAVEPNITRKITAQITSGSVSSGLRLKLEVSGPSGGGGNRGNAVSPLYLSTAASTIVNGIEGAFTGNSSGSGYNLVFSLEIQDYSLLRSGSNTFSITYTIADN